MVMADLIYPYLPSFSKTYLAWMNQGGVVAVANLRGGSEYGDAMA